MPWVKHSDQRWCDAAFCKLSDGAQALWFRADSYTANQLLDGFLPEDALRHMRTRKRYVDELVREGWWKRLEVGSPLAGDWQSTGGWLAVGWQERMRSKVDVLASRIEAKQRVSSKRSQEQKPKFAPPDPVPVKIPEEKEENLSLSSASRLGEVLKERAELFRVPLPEEPPQLAMQSPSETAQQIKLATRIEDYMEKAGRRVLEYAPSVHRRDSMALAAWCLKPGSQQDWKLDPINLAKAVCDGLLADDYARERGCPMALVPGNPPRYLTALKPVAKAPTAPPPPTRQEHVAWVPPPSRELEAVSPEEARELGMSALASLLPKLKLVAGAAE